MSSERNEKTEHELNPGSFIFSCLLSMHATLEVIISLIVANSDNWLQVLISNKKVLLYKPRPSHCPVYDDGETLIDTV